MKLPAAEIEKTKFFGRLHPVGGLLKLLRKEVAAKLRFGLRKSKRKRRGTPSIHAVLALVVRYIGSCAWKLIRETDELDKMGGGGRLADYSAKFTEEGETVNLVGQNF